MNLTGTSLDEARASCDRLAEMTIPRLMLERATESPDKVAIRFKKGGIYQSLTWHAYLDRVRSMAAGLVDLGVKPGDRFGIMGDTCIDYVVLHYAAHFCQAVPFGIYPTSSPEEVRGHLELSGARVLVAESQEHLDKLYAAEALAGTTLVSLVVLIDDRALFLYQDNRIAVSRDVAGRGATSGQACAEVDRRAGASLADDVAELTFTSGTTGAPKAACHTHAGLMIGMGYGYLEGFPELRRQSHRVVSHLPLAHLVERSMTCFVPLIADVVPHIGEKQQPVLSLLKDVKPTYLHAVPRIWEKLSAHVNVSAEMSHRLGRWAFAAAERAGVRRMEQLRGSDRQRADLVTEAMFGLAWLLVLWPALHKIGMCYAIGGVSGGAPLPPDVQRIWQNWGLPLRNFYGSTEGSVVGAQAGPWPAADTAMQPVYPKEVARADDGELLIRGEGLLTEYWRNPEATRDTVDGDGWLHSGDVATIDSGGGFLIVDRKKDILITSGGKNIAPAQVENALKASPYISEVIVFGDQRKFISALVEIDFANVSHWARKNGVEYTGFGSLVGNSRVVSLIADEIARANRSLARPEQVRKFRILPKELDPEGGDTTPTRKVKRQHTYNMFAELVEDMYREAS